jgi:tetratricopeptide (TPR) repeat protein
MSGVPPSALARAALGVVVAASAACTSLGVAPSRPAPATTAPAPLPPAENAPAPEPTPLPSPFPLPPDAPSAPRPTTNSPVLVPRPQSDASSASSLLLEQSRVQRAAGSLPAARASLERALRLDPNNPEVWIEIGELELQSGNNAQAATMARKALTLTGRDFRLNARAERLLRAAE